MKVDIFHWQGPRADFQVGWWWGGGGALMRTRKHEQSRGTGGTLPQGNFKFKSSEMAINASKTANSNINLQLLHRHLKNKLQPDPTLDPKI